MKTSASARKKKSKAGDGLRREYRFDHRKARPNRFATRLQPGRVVMLDPDVAKVFDTSTSVNAALRAMIAGAPKNTNSRERAG